jgi:exopolyphosphatase / guanosine-5'-triphosphate,3'-diphosphate pyrophosphatase
MTGASRRVAAIDCGTNSIRLLIADVQQDSHDIPAHLTEIDRRMTIVRLGEGVDRTGQFSAAALDRTFAACADYAELIAAAQVDRIRFVATSASRDVSNRVDFIHGVQERMGVTPEVISGAEEASLSFLGAVAGLKSDLVQSPVLVVDIGGGSTECVLGNVDMATPQSAHSADIGCVRMTERHLHDDPPTSAQVSAARRDIHTALDEVSAHVELSAACSMAAHDLATYDPQLLHGSVISREQINSVTDELLHMTRAQRAALAVMHPGRVDVIAGGALVLQAVVERTNLDCVVVSEADILDGIARALGALAG